MKHIITSNDTSINIKYIDDEESHYQLNIPNNDINKKLIENTVFTFEKSGTQTIIMHDDNNVFHLSKMECKYSEFIEIKNKLENTKKEVILLKQELSKNEKEMVNFKNDLLQQIKNNMVDFKNELFDTNNSLQKQIEKVNDKSVEDKKDIDTLNNDLQQQIKKNNYYFPFVVKYGNSNYDRTHYGNEQIVGYLNSNDIQFLKELKFTFLNDNYFFHLQTISKYIIIPPGKILITIIKEQLGRVKAGIYIYNKGIYHNINIGEIIMLINKKNIDNILVLLKKDNNNMKNLRINQIEPTYLEE